MTTSPTTTTNPRLRALIDDVRSSSKRRARTAQEDNAEYVEISRAMDSVDEFLEVGRRAIASLTLDGPLLDDARRRGCRVETHVWRPHAAGYIGRVSNGAWYRIVRCALQGAIDDLSIRQYNGDWRLAGAEITTFFEDTLEKTAANPADREIDKTFRSIVKRKSTRFFLIAMEIVDVKGGQAATFSSDDGMPTDADAVSDMPAQVRALVELARQGSLLPAMPGAPAPAAAADPAPAATSAELETLRERNDRLAGEVGELRAMMAQLLAASQPTTAAAAPAKKRRSRKKAAPAPAPASDPAPGDDIDEGLQALQALQDQG